MLPAAGAVLVLVLLVVTAIWLRVRTLTDVGALDRALENHRMLQSQDHAEHLGELERRVNYEFAVVRETLERRLGEVHADQIRNLATIAEQLTGTLGNHQSHFEQRQSEALTALQISMAQGLEAAQRQIGSHLEQSRLHLGQRMEALTTNTDSKLKEISGQVEQRLAAGFEKTTATFTDIVKRLALIDDAQKKITELSGNVVSLQEVLADKRSRGAFGEVQLNALVRNMLPETGFGLQHTLSNGRIADCVLFLPEPTGNVAIDSKFPLESYQRMTTLGLHEVERTAAQRTFKADIRKHIQDIASRYIVPGETADGAVMFLPAEAVFAEIQAHHPDLVQSAHDARVWMASPTTLMAILNTARAVLKDEATRAQVNIIQQHLSTLAKDFERFQQRMDNLSKHIKQAGRDVEEAHISARKISARFEKIERVELDSEEPDAVADASARDAPDPRASPSD